LKEKKKDRGRDGFLKPSIRLGKEDTKVEKGGGEGSSRNGWTAADSGRRGALCFRQAVVATTTLKKGEGSTGVVSRLEGEGRRKGKGAFLLPIHPWKPQQGMEDDTRGTRSAVEGEELSSGLSFEKWGAGNGEEGKGAWKFEKKKIMYPYALTMGEKTLPPGEGFRS